MPRVVILGTGGNCIDILETLTALNDEAGSGASDPWVCVGFLDDDTSRHGTRVQGVEVIGSIELASELQDCHVVNGIGSSLSYLRKPEIIARTGVSRNRFATLVHPMANVSPSARLGAGTVVLPNATIAAGVSVGDHVIVLPGAVLSHDDVVGDFACIAGCAAIAGAVTMERSCYIGANSSIRGGLTIGAGALVGMGSVVLRDVPPGAVVAGNPARVISSR